jgi:uncharacterized protein YggE
MSRPPAAVTVFGSAVLRVEPDSAALHFSVARQAAKPRDTLRETHEAVRAVRAFLTKAGVTDVAASRLNLERAYEYATGGRKPAGYAARVSLSVLLTDLDRVEDGLVGVVDAGVNEVGSVEFRTSQLREFRAEARRRAVAAARDKAEVYCRAAGVVLGPVGWLADENPNAVRGTGEGSTDTELPSDDSPTSVLTPGSIVVAAAVTVGFALA